MEDAYSFVVDFAGIRGQGFFAVFDGHAGKHAAEWCGQHFHEVCYIRSLCSQLSEFSDVILVALVGTAYSLGQLARESYP